ncbi:hypothetical protein P9222_14695 [Paenibacillus amylolyticus]|nr:hypothetical protein [Paenibacillus amylolyticus]WFR65138.1 hypothetical protein P9222_14695 [Paenibacillus amylolyticus]
MDGQTTLISSLSEYDLSTGALIASTDVEQRTTKYGLDAIGRTVEVTQQGGTTLRADYDHINNTIKVTDELGQQRLNKWNFYSETLKKERISLRTWIQFKSTNFM